MGRNQVRIIGGSWRGRKLSFPDSLGLRPTSDRVRETLFNWLMPFLPGATCLDLFAGSGALGFEAASRGAARVTMVEQDPRVYRSLQDNGKCLQAAQVEFIHQDATRFLARPARELDLVFLDPPFKNIGLLNESMSALTQRGWLKPGARIYIESAAAGPEPEFPDDWTEQKHKHAGQVGYRLLAYRLSS